MSAPAPLSARRIANGIPAIQARLESARSVEAHGEAFLLASTSENAPEHHAGSFSVSAPSTLAQSVRLSRDEDADTWLDVRPLGLRAATPGKVEQSTVVYANAERDLDLMLSLGESRLEELRVLRSPAASSRARYSLNAAPGMQLRQREGRIEALDASGRVAFQTNAAFAVDSAGAMRSVELELKGNELTASFDAAGLKYPIIVDPEWVTGPNWPTQAVVAQNSFELQSGGGIVGDVAVIQHATGAFIGSQAPAQVDSGAQLTGTLSADSIELQSGAVVTGDAHFNTLAGTGTVRGERFPSLALPVSVSVPNFPSFTPGTLDVTSSSSSPRQLAAGNYHNLTLVNGSVVQLTGGVYAFNAITFGSSSRLECLSACEIRLSGRLVESTGSFIGAPVGGAIGPDQVDVFVAANNGTSSLTAQPAVLFPSGITVRGRFFAENGTVAVQNGVQVVGILIGQDVLVTSGAQIVRDSGTVTTCTANDNNPCTQDSCNAAGQPVFTPLPSGTSCSDGNACNGVEACNGVGACVAGTAPIIDDGNPCTTDACTASSGVTHTPVAAGTSCSDGNACNGAETCSATGQCAAGQAPTVDDGNPCTTDACDPVAGVTHTPVAAGTSCSDGNGCNGAETCTAAGSCAAGTPPVVDDGNPCTADSCSPSTGVVHAPVAAGTSCSDGNACNGVEVCDGSGTCTAGTPAMVDDGNPCTLDQCDPVLGVTHVAVANGTSCGDGNACNGDETCRSGACTPGTAPTVNDNNPCTTDACDPVNGVTHVAVADGTSCSDGNACNGAEQCSRGACAAGTAPTLDDHNPCTADSCDAQTGVHHNPVAVGTSCSDGNACNGSETCDASGSCVASAPPTVDDGNPCTTDSCDPAHGVTHVAVANGTSCGDGNACNGDETCHSGACAAGTPPTVDDGNPCTTDACDPAAGVTHVAVSNGTSCSDGNACNGAEQCSNGSCAAGAAPTVDDGNPCTADSCDPQTGVHHNPVAVGTSCSDGNACNGNETCDASGSCSASTPPTVDDGNPCTVDACDPSSGVSHTPVAEGTSCDDGNACNGHEACNAIGFCAAGSAPTIDDGNPCTTDTCDAVQGVSHTPVAAGTACGTVDACHQTSSCDGSGTCAAGASLTVDDNNPCTTDSCDPTTGVSHVPLAVGTSCADANVCNGQEACDASGTCAAGTPPTVDDGDSCTSDSCDPVTGVSHTLLPGCDRLSVTSGGRYETRASLIGLVTSAGGPVTGYSLEVGDIPTIGAPRNDVSVSIQGDGSFRARLTTFPESVPPHTPPEHVLVKISASGFIPIEREAYLRPGDAVNLGTLLMIAGDPNVTMIGPEGGTATDSQGLVSLTVPAGSLSSPTPIRISPISTREQFPFPLPDTTATMYGVVLEPDGTQFAVPATLKFKNYRNAPTTLIIPVGYVNETNARWEHTGFATWDGQNFSTQIKHFTNYDANAAEAPGVLITKVIGGGDPNKTRAHGCPGSSSSYGSGALRQEFAAARYQRQGRTYGITLNYDSSLAGSVEYGSTEPQSFQASGPTGLRVGIALRSVIQQCVPSGSPAAQSAGCGAGGQSCSLGTSLPFDFGALNLKIAALGSTHEVQETLGANALSTGSISSIDFPMNADGTTPAGGYFPVDRSYTPVISSGGTSCVSGGASTALSTPGFGIQSRLSASIPAPVDPGPLVHVQTYELVYHRRASNYGAGWGVSEIGEAYVAPDQGQADLVSGDGQRESFLLHPFVSVLAQNLTSSRYAMGLDPKTAERFVLTPSHQLQKLNDDGSLTTVLSASFTGNPTALAIAYTPAGRQFVAIVDSGLIVFDQSGVGKTIASFSVPTSGTDRPGLATLGTFAYVTNSTDNFIYRTNLADASPTLQAFTASPGGDVSADPTGAAGTVAFQAPRGLAGAADGSLYVACEASNIVFRLLPQTDGSVGVNSAVQRAIGSGVGNVVSPLGAALPGPTFPLREPVQLAFSPDGTLVIVTLYGAATYDPQAQTARFLVLDADISNQSTQALFQNGSFFALSPTSLVMKPTTGTSFFRVDVNLASEYEPTRTVTISDAGLSLVDTSSELTETYSWADASKERALLTSRGRRTGESLLSVHYVTGTDRIDNVQDPLGGRMQFRYDGGGKLQSITDAGNRSTQLSVNSDGDLGTILLPDGDERQFTYDKHRMTVATAPNNESSNYTYNDNGTLNQATRAGGGVSTVSAAFMQPAQFAADGSASFSGTFTDNLGVTHNVVVDAAGNVERNTYVADNVTYDAQAILAGSLVAPVLQANSEALDAFTTRNNLLRISSTNVNGTPVTPGTLFDIFGRPTLSGIPPMVGETAARPLNGFFYNTSGRVQDYGPASAPFVSGTSVGINGFGLDYEPATGRLSRVSDLVAGDPTGRQTTYTWTDSGQPSTVTSHGVTTTFTYDPTTGNLATASNITGTDTRTYDAAGNLATHSDGTTTLSYQFDGANRLTVVQDALGNQTTLGYGQSGCGCSDGSLLTSIHTPDLPQNSQFTFSYNADGLIARTTDPTGATQVMTYDTARQLQTLLDPLERQTSIAHDQLGRLKTAIDPAGRLVTYGYPVPNSGAFVGPAILTSSPTASPATTDLNAPLGDGQYQLGQNYFGAGGTPARVEFYRDATFALSFGRLYDSAMRLARRDDRVGLPFAGTQIMQSSSEQAAFRQEEVGYIPNNDWSLLPLFNESDYPGRFEDEQQTYNTELDALTANGWDVPGTSTVDYTFTRDTAGRITSVAYDGLAFFATRDTATYAYNPTNGQLTTITNGSGNQTLTYDARGLLKTDDLSFDFGGTTPEHEGAFGFQYDAIGRNTRVDYPDGHFRTQSYDGDGRLLSRCYDGYPAPATARCYSATYDLVGNPVTLDDPEGHTEVEYDLLDRVKRVWRTPVGGTRTLEEEYEYNALGGLTKNVDTQVDDQRPQLSGSGTAGAAVPASHAGQAVTLDLGGQVTGFDGATFSFSKRATLTGVTQGSAHEVYTYDARSRRVARTPSTGSSEYYTYEGASIVSTLIPPTSDNAKPRALRRILWDSVDHPLWMYDDNLRSSVYFEVDAIGNVRRLRGGKAVSGGTTLASDLGGYRFSAFGQLNTTDTSTPYPVAQSQRYDQPIRWQGHWFVDIGPGFYDFRARVWSPQLATFMQPDEYGFLTRTGTLWSWPGQNPFKWRDPSGRDADMWFLAHAQTMQNFALGTSAAALSFATAGVAGELLGVGSLETLFGGGSTVLTTTVTTGAGVTTAAATSGGAATVAGAGATVAKVACDNEPQIASALESIEAQTASTAEQVGAGGTWPVIGETAGGAVGQLTPVSCGAACGEMLSGISQESLISEIGAPTTVEQLASAIGMRGGYVGPENLSKLVDMGEAWGAELRSGAGGLSHLVVVDGMEGANLIIRDPWAGGTVYQMTMQAFQQAWTGRAVIP